jgi:hypothetical protein
MLMTWLKYQQTSISRLTPSALIQESAAEEAGKTAASNDCGKACFCSRPIVRMFMVERNLVRTKKSPTPIRPLIRARAMRERVSILQPQYLPNDRQECRQATAPFRFTNC